MEKKSGDYVLNNNNDVQVDGEDFSIALRNLREKYGYDEDVETIVKMCQQWEDSFHKLEGRYHKLIIATTAFEAKIQAITSE